MGAGGTAARNLRVLGIDTSLRSTGLGIVEGGVGAYRGIAFDVLKNPGKRPLSDSLVYIQERLAAVLQEFTPDVVALEGVYFAKYAQTALILGEARGVVIATCAARQIPLYEYAPRRVKQAVVGYGAATKGQMQTMIVKLLGLAATPPEDAADALAIAICHLHNLARLSLSEAKRL